MANHQSMAPEMIALELVRIEKEHPTSHDGNKDSATLYQEYYKKVNDSFKG